MSNDPCNHLSSPTCRNLCASPVYPRLDAGCASLERERVNVMVENQLVGENQELVVDEVSTTELPSFALMVDLPDSTNED